MPGSVEVNIVAKSQRLNTRQIDRLGRREHQLPLGQQLGTCGADNGFRFAPELAHDKRSRGVDRRKSLLIVVDAFLRGDGVEAARHLPLETASGLTGRLTKIVFGIAGYAINIVLGGIEVGLRLAKPPSPPPCRTARL